MDGLPLAHVWLLLWLVNSQDGQVANAGLISSTSRPYSKGVQPPVSPFLQPLIEAVLCLVTAFRFPDMCGVRGVLQPLTKDISKATALVMSSCK
jgi:hypothetical protein